MVHCVNASYHHGDLRRALIEAAVAAMGEDGLGTLSLRAVAKRTGVSHAAPAHHFGDKAGLLTAVAVEGHGRFADALERAWQTTGDFVEVGAAYVRFAIDHRPYFEIMFRPELLHTDDPELERASRRSREMLHRGTDGPAGPEEAASGHNTAALAAWSVVHGFAELLLAGNLDPAIGDDPEGVLREIVRQLRF